MELPEGTKALIAAKSGAGAGALIRFIEKPDSDKLQRVTITLPELNIGFQSGEKVTDGRKADIITQRIEAMKPTWQTLSEIEGLNFIGEAGFVASRAAEVTPAALLALMTQPGYHSLIKSVTPDPTHQVGGQFRISSR